jgi:hypothetical protein
VTDCTTVGTDHEKPPSTDRLTNMLVEADSTSVGDVKSTTIAEK